MGSALDPRVLLGLASLAVLFAATFRARRGTFPPARALVAVSAGLVWLAYSLTELPSFLSPPHDDVLTTLAALLLLAGASAAARWRRRRGGSDDASA